MTSSRTPVHTWLSDMDGVLVHEEEAIPGAADFVARLRDRGRPFLLLTNNSIFTPRDLRARLAASGLEVPEEAIWTSALATAQFLKDQVRSESGNRAYTIGEAGLTTALHEAGFRMMLRTLEWGTLASRGDFGELVTRMLELCDFEVFRGGSSSGRSPAKAWLRPSRWAIHTTSRPTSSSVRVRSGARKRSAKASACGARVPSRSACASMRVRAALPVRWRHRSARSASVCAVSSGVPGGSVRRTTTSREGTAAASPGNLARLQGFDQSGLVDHRAARDVNDVGGRLHRRQLGLADQPARCLGQRGVDAHEVRGGERGFEGIVAADEESETARVVREVGCGIVVPPGRPELLASQQELLLARRAKDQMAANPLASAAQSGPTIA